MKPCKWLYFLLIVPALLLTSCHAHRQVTRGSSGVPSAPSNTEILSRPQYTGAADNTVTTALLDEAYSWLGTPYKYGGNDRKGADCSGFVMMVYDTALDIKLPRVSREQGEYCSRIGCDDLFPGDLVFFIMGDTPKVSHVGIYVGEGMMIHASSTKGVIVSDITKPYYVNHLSHYGRVDSYYEMVNAGTRGQERRVPEISAAPPADKQKQQPVKSTKRRKPKRHKTQ